jgi:predicted alpha/beta-hydrolase family hydrolase
MAVVSAEVKIGIGEAGVVSGILRVPDHATACYVMAHGAGAGMRHRFMAAAADGLGKRAVATLRYQFPYMENGSKRPDRSAVAWTAVRGAVEAAARLTPTLPLFAGGKSFGGRMTSQAQAAGVLPSVRGLAFFGFPLHPAGKPSVERGEHLAQVSVPMLFLQGTRDALAEMKLLVPVIDALGGGATLAVAEHADHSFHVPARSGTNDQQVLETMLDAMAEWMSAVSAAGEQRNPSASPPIVPSEPEAA